MSTPILHSQRDTHAGDPPPASTDSTADALIYLCDRGAHFVLCRPGGQHMYYADDQGRGNHKWTYKTAGGEIRSQRGYLLLHGDSLHHLHAAVKHGHYADYPFPAQQLGLFTPKELGPVVLPDADADPKLEPRRGGESWAQMAKRLETDLYTTLEGSKGVSGRNEALFNALRCWATACTWPPAWPPGRSGSCKWPCCSTAGSPSPCPARKCCPRPTAWPAGRGRARSGATTIPAQPSGGGS